MALVVVIVDGRNKDKINFIEYTKLDKVAAIGLLQQFAILEMKYTCVVICGRNYTGNRVIPSAFC